MKFRFQHPQLLEAQASRVIRSLTGQPTQLLKDLNATNNREVLTVFGTLLSDEGIKSLRLPSRSPNSNAHIERFFSSLNSECLDRLILFGEPSLRNAVREYLVHYHTERNHEGLGNRLIVPFTRLPDTDARIESTERLGGLLPTRRLRSRRP